MRLEITTAAGNDGQVLVRALLFNDSFEPVPLSRNAFTGPTPVAALAGGMPQPESVEPTYGGPDEPLTLQPFTFYGRERSFGELAAGEHQFRAEFRPPGGEPLRTVITVAVSATGAGS